VDRKEAPVVAKRAGEGLVQMKLSNWRRGEKEKPWRWEAERPAEEGICRLRPESISFQGSREEEIIGRRAPNLNRRAFERAGGFWAGGYSSGGKMRCQFSAVSRSPVAFRQPSYTCVSGCVKKSRGKGMEHSGEGKVKYTQAGVGSDVQDDAEAGKPTP